MCFEKTPVIFVVVEHVFTITFSVLKALGFSFKPVISKCKITAEKTGHSLGLVTNSYKRHLPTTQLSKRRNGT